MMNPYERPRRLRKNETIRRLVRETRLSVEDFIYPLFVTEGKTAPIASMPGQQRWAIKEIAKRASEIADLGIPAVLLFGIPADKDEVGSGAYAEDGVVQTAIRQIKTAAPNLLVIGDVCLCEYTSHGHCGLLNEAGEVMNDETLELLARTALSQAEAGVDMVAPSDMMDGRVGAIRQALDEAGFADLPIMSYAAKYASAFYGPFREAAESAPSFGDRRAYQLDPANRREALREIELDLDEGADIILIKPALSCLDIIWQTREISPVPVAAYNVSGEYAMVKAAAKEGWLEERKAVLEMLTAIKRSGADIIITYHAPEAAKWLKK
jgi:porphobilinogen synthase